MGYINFGKSGYIIAPVLTSGQIMVSGGANVKAIGGYNASGTINVVSGSLDLTSTYISPTGTNDTNSNYVLFSDDQQYDGSRSYAMWLYLSDTGSTQVLLDNYLSSLGTQVFINGGTPNLYLRLNNVNVFNFPANMNEWNHLVWTIDESANLAKGYLNGVEVASVANDRTYGTVSNMRLGSNVADSYPTNAGNYFDDYRYYTSVLTAAQVEQLAHNQYDTQPSTWLKLNEGTGTTVVNYGSDGVTASLAGVSSNLPVWVNPNATSSTVLQSAKSEVTAPRGYWRIQESFKTTSNNAYVITAGGLFYHNSGTIGTMKNDVGNSSDYTMGLANPVYNFSGGTNDLNSDMWVQGPLYFSSGQTRTGGNTIQMGTETSATTISHPESSFQINNDGGTLKGYHPLFPVVFGPNCRSLYFGSNAETRYLQDVKITEQEAFNGDNAWAAHADADGVLVISGNVEVNKSAGNNFDWATGSLQINKGNRLDIKQTMNVWNKASVNVSGGTLVLSGMSIYSSGTFIGGASSNLLYNNQVTNNDTFRMPYVASGTQFTNSQFRQNLDVSQNIGSNLIVGENNGTYLRVGSSANDGTHLQAKNLMIGGDSTIFHQNENTVTFSGNTVSLVGGIVGYSYLKFDNTPGNTTATQYFTAASGQSFTAAGLTIDTWVRTSDDTGIKFLFAGFYAGSTNYNKLYILSNGKVVGRIAGGGTSADLTSTTEVDDGNWHHIALTYFDTGDGGNDNIQRLYIDGKLEAEDYLNNTGGSPYTFNTFHVGSSYTSGDGVPKYGFKGDMAKFSVWKTALSKEQINRMMFMNHTAVSGSGHFDLQHCLSWFQFDGKSTTTEIFNLGSGSLATAGTGSTTSLWSIPKGYSNYLGGTGSLTSANSQMNLTSTDTTTLASDHARFGNISGGATASKNLNLTRWNGEQSVECRGAWKWGPGTILQDGFSAFGRGNTPWTTIQGVGYVEPLGGNTAIPFADLQSYWQSSGSLSSGLVGGIGGQPEVTINYALPTNRMVLAGDMTIQTAMMPSLSDGTVRIETKGHDLIMPDMFIYNGTRGGVQLDAGSTLYFKNDNSGFKNYTTYGSGSMRFIASGESTAMFNQFGALNNNTDFNYIDTNATIVGTGSPAAFTVSFWYKSPLNISSYAQTNTDAIGFNADGEGGISLIGSNWLVLCQGSQYKYFNSAPNGDGLWHHMLVYVDPANMANAKMWIDGSDQGAGSGPTDGTTNWSGDVYFGYGGYGAMPISLSDIRFYNAANTPTGSVATLAAINPATNPSAAYADPSNALNAYAWFKLNSNDIGVLSLADTIGTYNSAALAFNADAPHVRSGVSRIMPSGTTNNWSFDEGIGDRQLTNFYSSGSQDIKISSSGARDLRKNIWPGGLETRGTVRFD